MLIANFVSDKVFRRPARDRGLLEFIAAEPRWERELVRFLLQRGQSESEGRKTINLLKEDGIIIICDEAQRKPKVPSQVEHDVFEPVSSKKGRGATVDLVIA